MSTEKAIVSVKKHIEALGSAAKVINDPAIGNQLMTKFSQMYQVPIEEAQRFYEREKDNFGKMISQSPALQACTPMSAFLAFGKVMALKLTFDNGRAPLVYLIPGNRNIAPKGQPAKWITEMNAQPSPDGEKEVRINTGILKKVGQPIIVHKGDHFKEKLNTKTGEMEVEFEALNKSSEIIASFIRIVEPDDNVVYKVFKPVDWNRWKAASAKKNNGSPNALYTSGVDGQIDESFLRGKTTLHSFKGYKQVDYGKPAIGFVPDTAATKKINPSFAEEMLDDYEEVPNEQLPAAETDAFTASVREEQPAKESVQVQGNDDDYMFN